MVATISADIVRSTSLNTESLIALRNGIRGLFDILEGDYPGLWGRVVRGDSIECFVPECEKALRIAILIKLYVKMHVAQTDGEESLQRYGIRFSIGVGEIEYESKKEDIINGPAIYISGRNLDSITLMDDLTSFEIAGAPDSLNAIMDSYVAMAGSIVDSYSAKQSAVIYYKLRGFKEMEISRILGVTQSSVNIRSTNAKWGLLSLAIEDFEHFDFAKVCG